MRFVRSAATFAATALLLSACGGGGGGSTSSGSGGISVIPTTSPPPPGVQPDAYTCPSSSKSFGVVSSDALTTTATRRMYGGSREATTPSNVFAVTYAARTSVSDSEIESRVHSFGGRAGGTLNFDRIGRSARLVTVANGNPETAAAKLRSIPGVVAVSVAHRLSPQTRGATLTTDPYFKGASGTSAPLYQTSSTGGQWDMHVVGLEHAFSYGEGSTSVKLAIVDTGEDITHPDLSGAHVVRTRCFVTNAAGTTQSTGTFVTDPDGHGTDVTGIAAASTDNAFGFTGDAGKVSLMLYRVFPTPVDDCNNKNSKNPQCSSWDIDIASAINDAVANGANIISISLGVDGSSCKSGADPDPIQGTAVENAIAHGVIVVAASGNAGTSTVSPPGCDAGVIAVGASAWNDGVPNASGFTGSRDEYVPSYSNFGAPNTLRSVSSWGIVAPGGDGSDATGNNTLHWIENIWTTTPLDSTFAGSCGTDPYGDTGNCRIEITGTSMSTPHVAGAAALILSANPAYGTPSAMRQLLCTTADDIGDAHQGCGRLNVYRAMAKASGDPNLP